ncbi:hypothetical protein H0I76_09205 [Limibaculum sp. M0105]|uniref:DUF6867 domain-containing protein n=1 Tax=Thermohalobaculum xanthum TaxID=2753746 RepID=A0A8J7M6W1_9RHOB|nr:hypothetical protein [Thermohalobaculum xanthum]MBK0399366.1 hypothetical protein [Thermohalobaculum xanthum]
MGVIWETDFVTFFFVTLVIGGGAAFMSGRALASTWQPIWRLIFYMVLLAAAIRFFHFALFSGTLLSVHYYLVDAASVIALALLGYRLKRVNQMVTQYEWLYERAGPFGWRERG